MSFVDSVFPLFLLVVIPVWLHLARSGRFHKGFLVVSSLVFYGWNEPWWLVPLLFSCSVDYWAARGIVRLPRFRDAFLLFSLLSNLLLLGWFKYADFAMDLLGTGSPGASGGWGMLLPAGISFYTFQSLSYTIDVWAGRLQPARSLISFLAYVSCFPQLVAGPIVRAADLLSHIENPQRPGSSEFADGAVLILGGLAKKLLIADNIAPFVSAIFAVSPTLVPGGLCWWGALLFAVQIYGDFSGYTDIARGLGIWMGLPFPRNFNHPFLALGFRDFWQRWHVSLSTWFRDYVYIPLGGGRGPAWRVHLVILATFLLSGLWHGPAWQFVAWGGFHAFFLSMERVTGVNRMQDWGAHGRLLLWLLTFIVVVSSWVLFRAADMSSALQMYYAMLVGNGAQCPDSAVFFGPMVLGPLSVLFIWEVLVASGFWEKLRIALSGRPLLGCLLGGGALGICIFFRGPGHQFIYFQF